MNNVKETKLSHLTLEQQSDIEALIQEFKPLFSNVPKKTTKIKHDLLSKKTSAPLQSRPVKQAALDNEVQLIDVIEECKEGSSWSSPCILVPKADQSYRFVTDFRRVNEKNRYLSYSPCRRLHRQSREGCFCQQI